MKKDYSINSFTAADHILICNIHSIENQFSLNLNIEEIETGEIISSADVFTEPTVSELINSLPLMIQSYLNSNFQ